VSTLTVSDRPGTSTLRDSSPALMRMRTGTRCTILVKLPVAFCGGISEKLAPVPGVIESTTPWKSTSGSASTCMVTGWPGRIRPIWVSLKLAST
jgi:hypothetical protein